MRLKMFCAAALLFLIIINTNSFAQSFKTFSLTLKEASGLSNDSQKILTEKSPLGAGISSFAVPGLALGQFYNEQENKAFIHCAISAGIFMFTITYGGMKNIHIDLLGGGSSKSRGSGIIAIMAIAYAGNWIWSIVDAVISANIINKQVRLQQYRSDIMDRIKLGFDVNKNKQLNLKFAFEL